MANSGFNNSFDESFKTGMAIGGSAALETMKEKIKKNENKRKSDTIADTLAVGIFQKAQAENRELTGEEIIAVNSIEKLKKANLEPTEFTTLLKMGSPGMFKESSPISIFTQGNDGAPKKTGEVPAGSKVFKQNLTPEELKDRDTARGEAKIETNQKELATKTGGLIRRLDVLRKQYDEALPDSGLRSTAEQRIMGPLEVFGAKTGLKPNDKLMALKKNETLQAIQLIKLAGESGNLAQQEQNKAVETISNEGLTPKERVEAVKQFVEFAMAGADPGAVEFMLKKKNVKDLMERYGVDTSSFNTSESDEDKYEYRTVNGKVQRRLKSNG